MFRMHVLAAVLVICAPAHAAGTAVFRETTYDFGTVKQGQKVTHVFPVRNTGDTPVTIERVELQMPGVTARFRPLIAPGDEGKITLEWDTSHVTGVAEEDATVRFGVDCQSPAILSMMPAVRPRFE